MTIILPSHEENVMPIKLGHVLRTPSEDWPKYGIKWDTGSEFQRLVEWGRSEYVKEWDQGDPTQVEIVADASRRAFGGNDNNQILREKTAEVVAKHLEMQSKKGKREFYVLDVGSGDGESFITLLDKLPKDFKGDLAAILLDPAVKRSEVACKRVNDRGIKNVVLNGRQNHIPELFAKYLEGKKMSVVMQVASSHHDCNLSFKNFYDVTEDGGLFASGDWHPTTWQEPAYVLAMLEKNWPEYEKAIDNFKESYNVIKSKMPEDPKERKAVTDIFKFWKAYHKGLIERGGDDGSNSIWPLESHQDFRRYLRKMTEVGYSINTDGYLNELLKETRTGNPHSFYKDSTIIMGTYGQKLPVIS